MPGTGISTGASGHFLGLPDGREAPEAGARGDAGLPEQRAEPAAGAAADGQPARERRPDDAVQHLMSYGLHVVETANDGLGGARDQSFEYFV